MDFSLTDEQRIIQDTARSLFVAQCPLDLVKAAWENIDAAQPLWEKHLSDWLGLSEQPVADMTLFLEEYGRAAAPGVYFSSLLAAYAAATIDESLDGSATVAVAGANGYWRPNREAVKHFVPCASEVEQVVLVGGSPEAPRIALLPAEETSVALVDQMDRLRPQYCVEVENPRAGRNISPADWQRVMCSALVTTAAELVGVGRHLLDSAVEYAKEREQFGKPIGAFQGLQWKLVDVAMVLERAAAAVAWAAMCVDADVPETLQAVHSAKLEAGSAARQCARVSLQVHGGIGYTWEYGLHFWLRRAYAGDAFMGPADYHARCLAELIF